MSLSRATGEDCPDCEGTGWICAECGDRGNECCCDEPEQTDCDSCEGTGRNLPESND
jgi:hypothetical protein